MAGRPKGLPKTGGRAKGVTNKTTAELKEMILGALSEVGGQAYLVQQALDNPNAFMTLVGKVVPRDLNAAVDLNPALAERLKEARERAGA